MKTSIAKSYFKNWKIYFFEVSSFSCQLFPDSKMPPVSLLTKCLPIPIQTKPLPPPPYLKSASSFYDLGYEDANYFVQAS